LPILINCVEPSLVRETKHTIGSIKHQQYGLLVGYWLIGGPRQSLWLYSDLDYGFAFAMGLGFIRGVKMHSGITKGSKYLNINRYRYRYIYWQTKYRRIDLC